MADGDLLASDLELHNPVATLRKVLGHLAARPDDAPYGMSGQHYVDETYFTHEKRRVA